jgi:hypothetical protein
VPHVLAPAPELLVDEPAGQAEIGEGAHGAVLHRADLSKTGTILNSRPR